MSGNEEDYDNGIKYEIIEVPNFDGGVVTSAEGLTSFTRDRKSAEFEQLTDIEEIRMNSTSKLRRRRTKPKTTKTKGGLLAVNGDGDEQALTENEELYVSDDQIGKFYNTRYLASNDAHHSHEQDGGGGGATDTEDFSGDEGIIKVVNADIDPSVFQQEAFFSTITSSDGTTGKSAAALQGYSKISNTIKTREAQDSSADLSVTDVEDLAQSDADELLVVENVSRGPTPNLLRNAFNESASSRVYDQSKSGFDITNEAAHIKGYDDIQANHTDTECLE